MREILPFILPLFFFAWLKWGLFVSAGILEDFDIKVIAIIETPRRVGYYSQV
jgi:hypothetical protein